MGASDTHLAKLDAVQDAAAKLIGPSAEGLESLDHRRRVGALTYLYKLQAWDCPDRLKALVPPPLPYPVGRTRAQVLAQKDWHPAQFADPLPIRSRLRTRRSFPYCMIRDWNGLPQLLFARDITLDNLQSFKEHVNAHALAGGLVPRSVFQV